MPPSLVLNPRHDEAFVARAKELANNGVHTPDDLCAVLRERYPKVSVHARELSGESYAVWYVYRDGRWVE